MTFNVIGTVGASTTVQLLDDAFDLNWAFEGDFYDGSAPLNDSVTFGSIEVTVTPIPVPAAVWLFGSALGLLGWMRRKKA